MNNLAEIMRRVNITPVQLSEQSGVASNTIRRIMQDRNVIPYNDTSNKLSKVLGYTVAQIRGEKDI